MAHLRKTLVVVGHGMVGHRFVQAAVERGLTETHDVVVVGEEVRPAYDRVALTSFFEVGADALSLLPTGAYDDPRVRLVLGTEVTAIDAGARTLSFATGEELAYDELVLATGAAPFVPPVPGKDPTAASSTAPSRTSRRSARRPPARRSARWSAAACSGWRPPTRWPSSAWRPTWSRWRRA